MTLRTIESEFSEQLLAQSKGRSTVDLTIEGPVMEELHPKLIWAKLLMKYQPDAGPAKIVIPDWNYACFSDLIAAEKSFPQIGMKFIGKPWSVHQFLETNQQEAIIEFPPLGAVVLSKKTLPEQHGSEIHDHLLPHWISYALSPELWAAQGKWTRLHARLQKLFEDHKLLETQSKIGYYQLVDKAYILKDKGFVGTSLEKSYVLVVPWTFSLSDMQKLEEIIQQEF
jgi:hypothetical protein